MSERTRRFKTTFCHKGKSLVKVLLLALKMKLKHVFLFIILLVLIIESSIVFVDCINHLEKKNQTEKVKDIDYNMTKFEVEEKPAKLVPYEQKTDSEYYRDSLYSYLDKIEKARDKPIRK